jgi:NAD(P)H-hydrate repair Nnr-like enzyme with NAD(P)H-hydrate dehydratase domain
VVLTPHYGELVPVLASAGIETDRGTVQADPRTWALRAAAATGATVLLKGSTTWIADPSGPRFAVQAGPPWVATAGAGDVLGGVLGALVATHADEVAENASVLAELAAAAAWLHGEAGRRASRGGPIVALDIAEALPEVLAGLLAA